MEIDFDALDQVISKNRNGKKSSSPAAQRTPKYIDVIQAGAVKKPNTLRQSTKRVKKVITKKVEKVAKPAVNISELIDRELESGDTALGENLPRELNVDDLVSYAENTDLSAEIDDMNPRAAAEDFLSTKHELVPFLPNIKVDKKPLSSDIPERVAVSTKKSDRELASQLIEDDLVADKPEPKESKEQARILSEERLAPKKEKRAALQGKKKASTGLIVLLGVLIAVFGAVAGAFIYLITNE
jgi:ribosomal protein L19E